MPDTVPVPLADLLIDAENPRLPQPNVGQREALRAIATHQNKKLQALARDIVQHGLNPSDLPIVMPLKDDLKRYVVVEGNRRLTALRALENPEFLVDAVSPGVLKEIRRLSKQYQDSPIDSVMCASVRDRDEARHWIELRHTGENAGAGIVPWGSDDAARYRARTVGLEIQSQALNLLERRGDLTPEGRRKIPATSLKRLLETPAVRAKLGYEVVEGQLYLLADEDRVAKGLLYIVEKLVSGDVKVRDIYTASQRVKFATDLPRHVTVVPTAKPGEGVPASGDGKQVSLKAKKGGAGIKAPRNRDKLIPRDCALNIVDPRLRIIERELRRLSLAEYTNAVSVLLRVFIELSADAYIDAMKLATTSPEKTLSNKIQEVINHLVSRKKLTGQQAKSARAVCNPTSVLVPTLTLMHQYIHNQHTFPAPADLRAFWDSFQPFVIAIWAP
ncbi:MAG: hypothetical protein ABR860_00680 [Terracidiphilus sp.]|jgi:hypothetical protein